MKKRILWAALITLIGFPLLGWVLLYFFREFPTGVMLRSTLSFIPQIALGIGLGVLFGLGARRLVSLPFLAKTEKKYSRIIANLKLGEIEIIFVSLCAGFGEELLFRGAIQPLIGIWPTAIIFVAIHGYLDPRDWRVSIYGVYMTLVIAGLGYFTDLAGIFGACVAHAAIDYVLFQYLISKGNEYSSIPAFPQEFIQHEKTTPDEDGVQTDPESINNTESYRL